MAGVSGRMTKVPLTLHGFGSGASAPTRSTSKNSRLDRIYAYQLVRGQYSGSTNDWVATYSRKWADLLDNGVWLFNPNPGTPLQHVWVRVDVSQDARLMLCEVDFWQLGDPDDGDPGGGTLYIDGYARLKVRAKQTGFYGNDIDTLDTVAQGAWGAATLEGGSDTVEAILDGETLTIGDVVYTFRDTLASAYDVQIDAQDAINTVNNLILAINATGTPGTHYGVGTAANPYVTAVAGDETGEIELTSTEVGVAGNDTATTETMTDGAFTEATLTGGVTPTYYSFPGFTFSSIATAVDSGAQGYTIQASEVAAELMLPDLKSGIWEHAQCLLREVSWQNPDNGYLTFFGGEVGPIEYNNDREVTIEVQGLLTRKRQWSAASWSPTCRADLGDALCAFEIDTLKVSFTVDTVVSQTKVESSSLNQADEFWTLGVVHFLTGNNAGFAVEIAKSTLSDTSVEFMHPLPFDVEVGDTAEIWPGCDKNYSTCRDTYKNTLNFQGEPFWPTQKGIVVG